MRQLVIAVSILVVLGFFQNCGQAVDFGQDLSSNNKAMGDLTAAEIQDPDVVREEEGEEEEAPGLPREEVVVTPPVMPPVSSVPSVQEEHESAKGNFVCILDGPGKSVKLALSGAGVLQGQNATPHVVCVTEKGCLEIASGAFTVKGAYKRGYCKKDLKKHVHLSDAELAAKILALKTK